jgi:hypothetical protein
LFEYECYEILHFVQNDRVWLRKFEINKEILVRAWIWSSGTGGEDSKQRKGYTSSVAFGDSFPSRGSLDQG